MMHCRLPLLLSFLAFSGSHAQYTATYLPDTAPEQTEQGQYGTNKCGTGFNQTSLCQNSYLNGVQDFCLWAPPSPGADSVIGNTERFEVAWCLKNGTGSRLIPDGAITGAHFVQTPDYVQITGVGNMSLLNIPAGDGGGELDPHGADGNGNPIGGLVFSSAFGKLQQIFEWTNFMGSDQFCFRACNPDGPNAAALCQHIYDVLGCDWNIPGNYNAGVFESCKGDTGEPMGVYGGSTFHQGDPATPAAHPPAPSSSCTTFKTIGNSFIIQGTSVSAPTTSSKSATQTGSSVPSVRSGTSSAPTATKTSAGILSLRIPGWAYLFVVAGCGALTV